MRFDKNSPQKDELDYAPKSILNLSTHDGDVTAMVT
jgi:hypothetical protein